VLARVRQLFSSLLIYGMGDVATSLISLLLLPIFVRYLSVEDYGIIAMLLAVEAATKVVFRWGVDTAFMRLYYDCTDQAARQRLASTIFLFLLVVNGALLLGAVLASGWLSTHLVDSPKYAGLITLTLVNIFFANFFFIPYHVIRIQQKPRLFIALTFTRSIGTVVARVVLVMWAGMGVTGIVVADVIVTVLMTLVLGRWFAGLLRPVFSRDVLREALGFGLPRVPHSVAQQVISVSDRYFLKRVGDLADVGLYSIGASFGMALKLFLSAFEFAWTPFFLSGKNLSYGLDVYRSGLDPAHRRGVCGGSTARAMVYDARVLWRGDDCAMDLTWCDVSGAVFDRIHRVGDHQTHQVVSGRHRDCGRGERGDEPPAHSAFRDARRRVGERARVCDTHHRDGRVVVARVSDCL
jgi:hypothetical protein